MKKFDEVAKSWDKEKRRHERAKFAADKIKELSKVKGHGLDFGAGTGLLGFQLIDYFDKVSFFDTSKGMIEVLREKAENVANAEILEEFKGKFDCIFNMMVMHHITNHREVAGMFYENLNPKGELYVIDLEPEDGGFHGDDDSVAHEGIDKDILKEIMVEAGFEDISFYKGIDVEKNGKSYPTFIMRALKK